MIYLESEAHTKRCTPMQVVHIMDRERLDAMMAVGAIELNCIGSRCAQWREARKEHAGNFGYCGLAGAPS